MARRVDATRGASTRRDTRRLVCSSARKRRVDATILNQTDQKRTTCWRNARRVDATCGASTRRAARRRDTRRLVCSSAKKRRVDATILNQTDEKTHDALTQRATRWPDLRRVDATRRDALALSLGIGVSTRPYPTEMSRTRACNINHGRKLLLQFKTSFLWWSYYHCTRKEKNIGNLISFWSYPTHEEQKCLKLVWAKKTCLTPSAKRETFICHRWVPPNIRSD